MKILKVTLIKGKDDYGAWVDGIEGVYGAGNSPAEAKQSILEAIDLYKKYNKQVPTILRGDYKVVYKMDTESLLNYFKGLFTNSGLEKITGINQKQLHHYSTGLKKPRQAQKDKIESALHKLGEELMAVKL